MQYKHRPVSSHNFGIYFLVRNRRLNIPLNNNPKGLKEMFQPRSEEIVYAYSLKDVHNIVFNERVIIRHGQGTKVGTISFSLPNFVVCISLAKREFEYIKEKLLFIVRTKTVDGSMQMSAYDMRTAYEMFDFCIQRDDYCYMLFGFKSPFPTI